MASFLTTVFLFFEGEGKVSPLSVEFMLRAGDVALELSRLDAEREKSASLMLELQSASSSSPPKLNVLGATSVSGAKVRVCSLTGIPESDPFTEEKTLFPFDFSVFSSIGTDTSHLSGTLPSADV